MTTSMKAILICPEYRPAGSAFQRMKPLALMPVLGRSLLDHALSSLKKNGVTEVQVLACDRPEVIRDAVGKGEAWGLSVEVTGTRHELAADVAELRYGGGATAEARPRVIVLDSMPGFPDKVLWHSHESTFALLREAMQKREQAAQLTMHEISPGIWISTKASVSSKATLVAPVWIGPHASIGAETRIGPDAVVEAGAFIDAGAVVKDSWIGPGTYVGSTAAIRKSFAWGNGLLNWSLGSFLEVRDTFLLNDISRRSPSQRRASLMERLAAFLLMLISSPLALAAMIRSKLRLQDTFFQKRVILPPVFRLDAFSRTYPLLNLRNAAGLLKRWPELWLVVRGDMALVGNRPLSAENAIGLRGSFGQLWLECPAGVFSLADAEGADAESISESQAHAAYFSATRTLTLRLSVLRRCLWRFIVPIDPAQPMKLSTAQPQ